MTNPQTCEGPVGPIPPDPSDHVAKLPVSEWGFANCPAIPYWADYVGDVLERISAGQPEPPDQDWEALNRMVAEDGKGKSWDEVIVAAERGSDRARAALLAMTEVTDSAGSEFTDETVDHYEEHTAEIVAFAPAG